MMRNRTRLLVVEDDRDLLFIEMKTLKMAGYDVDGAHDVDSALRRLDHRQYDVVLTDLGLPGKSGNHLVAEACQRNICCIAITAHAWDPIAQVAREIGCNMLILKPFKAKELVDAVERVLADGGEQRRSFGSRLTSLRLVDDEPIQRSTAAGSAG